MFLDNYCCRLPVSGLVTTLAGGGSAGGTASGLADGTGSAATFYNPSGVSVDSLGVVYVADSNNYLIRKIGFSGISNSLSLPHIL